MECVHANTYVLDMCVSAYIPVSMHVHVYRAFREACMICRGSAIMHGSSVHSAIPKSSAKQRTITRTLATHLTVVVVVVVVVVISE